MPVCVKTHNCRSCHKRFSDEDRLRNHLNRAHGSEVFRTIQCKICFKCFLNTSALGSHLRTHNDQGSLWECLICKETCCNREDLKEHIDTHSNNGSFPCPSCEKVFSRYISVRKHIIKTHRSSGVQCSLCNCFCPDAQMYKEHMLRHSVQKQHACAHCEKQFTRGDKLKEHIKRVHAYEPSEESCKSQEEKLLKKKMSEMKIEKKLRDLNAQYLFKCQPCLLGFKRRGMLVNHIAKHHPNITPEEVPELNLPIMTTSRDFFCHLCEKVYKSNAKRKAHIMKFHSDALKDEQTISSSLGLPAGTVPKKPEQCPCCHKQYATNAKLLQHMRSQHPEKSHAELRKRGKPHGDKIHADSEKKYECYNTESITKDESLGNDSGYEGYSVDAYGSDMFIDGSSDVGLYSPDTSSVIDIESAENFETLLSDCDDDLSLAGIDAVCLMLSHNNFPPLEETEDILAKSSHVMISKSEISDTDFSDAVACIGEDKTFEETSLMAEDVDLSMAEWLVDLQTGPPIAQQSVIHRTRDGINFESIGNIPSGLSDLDSDPYGGSDYQLYDLNTPLTSTQVVPAQTMYSPYPPH